MALITNIRIGQLALTATVLLAMGAHLPAPGSTGIRGNVEIVAAKPTETVDPPGIYGAEPDFAAVIQSAINRFDSVGLKLPELRIYYHSDPSGCPGASALFNLDGSGTRVDLCTRVTYTLLHELAHAWEYHTMSDATRQAYLDYTGLATWADPEIEWADRGIESAATTIAWGLLEIPITNPAAFVDELHRFELLTGIASPRTNGN